VLHRHRGTSSEACIGARRQVWSQAREARGVGTHERQKLRCTHRWSIGCGVYCWQQRICVREEKNWNLRWRRAWNTATVLQSGAIASMLGGWSTPTTSLPNEIDPHLHANTDLPSAFPTPCPLVLLPAYLRAKLLVGTSRRLDTPGT
jgi:hypothetical protein